MATKKIETPYYTGIPMRIRTNGFLITVCCDCELRHLWHFRIIRGKKKESDQVAISSERDDTGTKLLKFYDKNKSKKGRIIKFIQEKK